MVKLIRRKGLRLWWAMFQSMRASYGILREANGRCDSARVAVYITIRTRR